MGDQREGSGNKLGGIGEMKQIRQNNETNKIIIVNGKQA